ncbi:MAG: extracellular solute-binding protein, partial [Oscillospiraceae bacterium]|nr:extracellular solute-binding protein [Oscillospiraceae bacterium]
MKKIVSILACATLLAGMLAFLSACGGPQLNVCNWGEYISDGAEGSRDIIREFEKATGIKVKYSTFPTNEALYAKLAGGGVKYDVIIPSDYLIERLVAEDRLEPLDF